MNPRFKPVPIATRRSPWPVARSKVSLGEPGDEVAPGDPLKRHGWHGWWKVNGAQNQSRKWMIKILVWFIYISLYIYVILTRWFNMVYFYTEKRLMPRIEPNHPKKTRAAEANSIDGVCPPRQQEEAVEYCTNVGRIGHNTSFLEYTLW